MTLFVFLAVLFAALLHASWNAILKSADDKLQGMFALSAAMGLIGAILAAGLPIPTGEVWLWLIASAFLHTFYKAFLTFAYERGDLSRVYPIARGTAPMIVAIAGAFLLADDVAIAQYAGILLVGLGILAMVRGVFTSDESRILLPFAFASALATAGYSLVDGVGARLSGNATMYVVWMFILDAALFCVWARVHRGPAVVARNRRLWMSGAVAGVLSFGAYWIAVQAMTVAPIALVTALRETSVLFAVLIGVLFFRERADRGKLVAAGVIVAGIILIRV